MITNALLANIFLIFLILIIVCALIVIYQVKFTIFIEYCKQFYYDYLELFGAYTKHEREKDKNNPPQKRSLSEIKIRIFMPLILTFLFPLCYFLVEMAMSPDELNPFVLFFIIIGGLIDLCLMFLSFYEKNPQKKFWMLLPVVIFMELGVAFDLHLFTSGYVFTASRGPKTLMNAILFIPFFLTYALQLQRTYLCWRHPELLPEVTEKA